MFYKLQSCSQTCRSASQICTFAAAWFSRLHMQSIGSTSWIFPGCLLTLRPRRNRQKKTVISLHNHQIALAFVVAANCNRCCLLHAVKMEAMKAEQQTYRLMSEERLLREQMELQDSGIKSAPTPVSAACLLIMITQCCCACVTGFLINTHAAAQAAHSKACKMTLIL